MKECGRRTETMEMGVNSKVGRETRERKGTTIERHITM